MKREALGFRQTNSHMNFNEIIKNKIYPVLKELDFSIKEEYNNVKFGSYIEFNSKYLVVVINYDNKEKLSSIFIGNNNSTYELTDDIIHDVFGEDISINNQSDVNIFIERLCALLQKDKVRKMLKGNINDLAEASLQKAHTYSTKLLLEQYVKKLSKAWDRKDYVLFVKIMDKLDITALPKSYQLKYKISKNKILEQHPF